MAPARKKPRKPSRSSGRKSWNRSGTAASYSESDSEESLNSNSSQAPDCETNKNTAINLGNAVIRIPQLNFSSNGDIAPNFGFSSPPPPIATEPVDASLGFEKMAGCEGLIEEVKSRIIFPILNKSFMERHGRSAPKGIMLHGPPGTGKTLFAKCLAAELSRMTTATTRQYSNSNSNSNSYSFFMRRGTDIMSMWVGESEKSLRAVFARAIQARPSILFFDEIDSLAPNRNSLSGSSCPAFSNVVTTLLGEMDKVRNDGQVIILFATNRLETVDPALRRPGRCDVSIQFHSPNVQGRRHILELYTQNWGASSPSAGLLNQLALSSNGYTGADLNKLCSEAFFACVRRTQQEQSPSTSLSELKPSDSDSPQDRHRKRERGGLLSTSSVKKVSGSERVTREDWTSALTNMGPSPTNVFGSYVQLLQVSDFIQPLILQSTNKLSQLLQRHIPGQVTNRSVPVAVASSTATASSTSGIGGPNCFLVWNTLPKSDDILDALIIPTVFGFPELNNHTIFVLNEETMLQEHKQISMNSIIDIINQAKKCTKPSILFIPRIDKLAHRMSGDVGILRRLLFDTASKSVLVVATASTNTYRLPTELQPIFDGFHKSWQLTPPSEDERWEFFSPIFDTLAFNVASIFLGQNNNNSRRPASASSGSAEAETDNFEDEIEDQGLPRGKIPQIKKKSNASASNDSNSIGQRKTQTSGNDIKLSSGLDKILDKTIDVTDHDDMWSMITLHRELTNICKRYECQGRSSGGFGSHPCTGASPRCHQNTGQLKVISQFLDDLNAVVSAYENTHLEVGKK